MKTIEQGIGEIRKTVNGDLGTAYRKGFEEAQRWIPVEEELPEHSELLMKGRCASFDVIAKRRWDDNGEVKIEINNRFRANERIEFCWNYQYGGSNIIEWRPINRK